MRTFQNDEAVSPVIGVILMVAITVILAAVIAAFVFGMAGTTSKSHNVAATAQVVGNQTVVTYQGGPDNLQLATDSPLNATFTASDGTPIDTTHNFGSTVSVGDTAVADHTPGGVDHVVVVAKFSDGAEQVILDSRV